MDKQETHLPGCIMAVVFRHRNPGTAAVIFFLGGPLVIFLASTISRSYWKLVKNTGYVQSGHPVQMVVISIVILYLVFAYITLVRSSVKVQSIAARRTFRCAVLSLLLLPISFELANRNGYFTTEITLKGEIQPSMFVACKGFVDKSLIKPRKLIVTSPGGNLSAAMAIGKLVHQLEMDVEVRGYCASACANHIFPAGKRKIISRDALIVYHGGMRQQNYLELSRQMDLAIKSNPEQSLSQVFGVGGKEVSLRPTSEEDVRSKTLVESFLGYVKSSSAVEHAQQMRVLEDKFFEDLNIDPNITIYGQTGIFQNLYESYEYIGFYYSLEDMEKMGVTNISVVGGFWEPEENNRYANVYLASVHDEYPR